METAVDFQILEPVIASYELNACVKSQGLEAHSASGTPHRVAGKWKKTFVKEHWSQETARDNSYCRWIVSWVLPLGQEQRGHTAPWVPLQRREGPCVGLWGDLLAPMV